ncbi:MAG: hypothetical protein KA354_18965 [Phycisphaerae bacterium]|nr:hypothetical protein [Phycisphaerae bacterium]
MSRSGHPRGQLRVGSPTQIDPGGPILPEWNLRCLKCGYDLTGLLSRRCPECGELFKPRETWQANRLKHAEPFHMPSNTAWIVVGIILPASVFLACTRPLLLFLAPVWMAVEFTCARLQAKPFWPRVVLAAITAAAVAYTILRLVFP